jgi:hypothetical protein
MSLESEYIASKTTKEFHKSDDIVRLLIGPVGSGKSVACCVEILLRALKQPVDKDNIRKSRWLVVRNTYSELRDTTIRTFFDWIPESIGRFNKQNFEFNALFEPGDGTIVHLEIMFRALDKPKDVRKLLSLELTGAWINEAREVPKAVFEMILSRLGRYPSRKEVDDYWYGLILDTNPCDVDHWIYKTFEEDRPEGYKKFHQPSGLDKFAENRKNLPKTYYETMMVGKTQEWTNVYVHGMYGFVTDGKPIYPEYNDDVHVSSEIILPDPQHPIIVGIDFGLTPAATINQQVDGQWRVIDEIVTERMGALNFGTLLGKKLRSEYSGYEVELFGDPAGAQEAQTDETTPFEMLASLGLFADPAPTNDWMIRREAVAKLMSVMTCTGQPGFIVSPKARYFRKGLSGGYAYRRLMVIGEDRFHDKPNKNIYSHVCESHQYAVLGAGEGYEILGYKQDWGKSVNRRAH